ncbi:6-bladed beta-propeller [Algoriphagus marinus]|uniref:6-bladed beta-propeller n=1 Tax=Algoriphagus marinus TaxID=1925762 RepID=UPI00094B8234|nr:6-bladed beta-propeller [Algoriphagus marinus]
MIRRIAILLFCLVGCAESVNDEVELGNIKIQDKLLISEISEGVEYLVLDKESDAVIYGVDKLIYENDRFFILDNSYTETLAVFTDTGTHLFSLEIGLGGPDEFVEISDFDYDPASREIFVFSGAQRKIFVYDENGNPSRQYRIPSSLIVHSIGYLGQNRFAFFRDMVEESKLDLPSQLFTYDFETEQVIDQAIPLSKNELILSQDFALVRSGGELFASKVYDSSIFAISGTGQIKEVLKFSDVSNLSNREDIIDDESYRKVITEENGILYMGYWRGNLDNHLFLIKNDQRPIFRWKSKTQDVLTKSIQNDFDVPIFSGYNYLNNEVLIAVLDEEAIGLLQGIPEGRAFLKKHKPEGEYLSPIIAKIKLK